MTVRAKFVVQSKEHDSSAPDLGTVLLHPVTSGSPENDSFFKWTPAGMISLSTVNTEAFNQFEPGQAYYVDFTPVEVNAPSAIQG